MIQSLFLKSFGKFRNREFKFLNVNFILGKNESGKSTIFDALLHALTEYRVNSIQGKKIIQRYGKDFDVALETSILKKVDLEEFINLHCLKSGEIGIDFENGKWIGNFRNKLLSGGMDTQSILSDLESDSNTIGSTKRGKKIKELETSTGKIQEEIQQLESKKSSILTEAETLKTYESKKQELDQIITKIKDELSSLYNIKSKEDTIAEKLKLKETYTLLKRKVELTNLQLTLSKFNNENLTAIQNLEQKIHTLEDRVPTSNRNINLATDKKNEMTLKINQMEDEFNKKYPLENLARNLKNSLDENIEKPFLVETVVYQKPILFVSIGMLLVGILSLLYGWTESYLFTNIGILLCVLSPIIGFLSRKNSQIPDSDRMRSTLTRYKLEWKDLSGEELTLYDNFQSLRDYFFQLISSRKSVADNIQLQRALLNELQKELAQLTGLLEATTQELNSKKISLREFLSQYNVNTKEEFLQKNLDYYSNDRILHELNDNLSVLKVQGNLELLRIDIERKLAEFDRNGIPDAGMDSMELNELNSKIKLLSDDTIELDAQLRNLEITNASTKASIETRLEPLNKNLIDKQNDLIQNQVELKREYNTIQAIKICVDIFRSMENESDKIMESLASEVQESLKHILPNERKVILEDLNQGKIQMEDESGDLRLVSNLSLGTKDCFYIASKLTFCEKNNRDMKLFLMDEPFSSLDRFRSEQLIRLIYNFSKDKGWQFIVFSKDLTLQDMIDEVFTESDENYQQKVSIQKLD